MSNNSRSLKRPRTEEGDEEIMEKQPAPLPYAETVEQFLSQPLLYTPKPIFLAQPYQNEGENVLTFAVRNQNVEAVEALIRHGANVNTPNARDITPLAAAAHKGNITIMKYLISAGALVDGLNTSGSTALIQAAHFGHSEAVRLLLLHNASADAANHKGTTALMRSSQEGHVQIAMHLLRQGADVNRKNLEGMNALMLASQRGHSAIVALLIEHGAIIDVQTAQGSTALMLACKRGHTQVVDELVSRGAEIFIKDHRGRSALDTTVKRNHVDLLPLLNTSYQLRKMEAASGVERTALIKELRKSYNTHPRTLRVAPDVLRDIPIADAIMQELSSSAQLLHETSSEQCRGDMRFQKFTDVKWPLVMMKIFSMPLGVFEHIVEFIPAPRVWDLNIQRLQLRAKLNPIQALLDTSTMIDEILSDTIVFTTQNQSNILVRMSRCPQAIWYLNNKLLMPPVLTEMLMTWADTQSIIHRATEAEITFKTTFARNFITVASNLFKWYRTISNASTVIAVHAPVIRARKMSSDERFPVNVSLYNLLSSEIVNRQGSLDMEDMITDAGGDEEEEGEEEDDDEGMNEISHAIGVGGAGSA